MNNKSHATDGLTDQQLDTVAGGIFILPPPPSRFLRELIRRAREAIRNAV